LPKQAIEDLNLWQQDFLPLVQSSMSLNLISFRRPSYICWSNACPAGMGGFDHLGNAWRLAIPFTYHDTMSNRNNCLEFIASIITVWQAIKNKNSSDEECFLSLGDNSSSVGWLHKANIDKSNNLPLFIASRKYGNLLLASRSCLYSQHIPGVSNGVADVLSRRHDLNDNELMNFIFATYQNQVPASFQICPVHPEISSWVTYWLQICRDETKALHKTQR
jgi:hypothetical protein